MQIVFHLGAHCTDDERLLRCLLKNRGTLAGQGIHVPGPARYRNLLRDTAIALKGTQANAETQAMVLDQILEDGAADRVILSWDSFMSYPAWSLKSSIYPSAGERLRAFSQIFPDHQVEFHLAIRNPATFLPALFERQKGDAERARPWDSFMGQIDPRRLRWSDTLKSVLATNPGVSLTLWSDEDAPLIWPEVLAEVSGHAPGTRLEDDDDLLAQIMSAEGFSRLRAYLASHPPASPEMRRKVVSAFLDKFAKPERLAHDFTAPGWTPELVALMTDAYEEDCARIMALPNVRFLTAY